MSAQRVNLGDVSGVILEDGSPAAPAARVSVSKAAGGPQAAGSSQVGSGPRKSEQSTYVVDGMDKEKKLWHGRDSATEVVHHYVTETENRPNKGSLGMIQGIIIPCMGNILGVIVFLRGPWITGKAGIRDGLGVAFICCLCTFLTALSLSAIATNGKIPGGGAYFLISRSLGPALGASVGLCFYMANSIGAAMYFMGTVEAWEVAFPSYQLVGVGDLNNIRATGYVVLGFAVLMILMGMKLVSRAGSFFLLLVMLTLAAMYIGCLSGAGAGDYTVELKIDGGTGTMTKALTWSGPSAANFRDNWEPGWDLPQGAFPDDTTVYNFVNMMGLYFPSVTGIMAGANRSADLKDPTKSIPGGTLFAQVFTSIIYLSFVIIFGCVAPRETLLNDKFFASTSAWPVKEVVVFGVIAATIGAGLNSMISGTKLLTAIASDGTMPILKIFATKPGQEPRLALFASAALCALAISIASLNAIAPILTMFFLMEKTMVNMSCTILHIVGDPNWRPTFRYYHWSISLMAALLCIWMMFAMAPGIAVAAIVFCGCVFSYAAYNSASTKWGDGLQGMKFQVVKNLLIALDSQSHTKNWRPQLLLITHVSIQDQREGLSTSHPELLRFASQLKNGRGFIMLGGICTTKMVGGRPSKVTQEQVQGGAAKVKKLLADYQMSGFGRIVYTDDFSSAVATLVQTTGIGSFQPNCIMSYWPEDPLNTDSFAAERRMQFVNMVQASVFYQKVCLLQKGVKWPEFRERLTGTIDIWWIVGDGGILLLLPFLLAKHSVWRGCRSRLYVLAYSECWPERDDNVEAMQKELDMYVHDFRLNIEVHVKVVNIAAAPAAAAFPSSSGEVGGPGGDGDEAVPGERPEGGQRAPGSVEVNLEFKNQLDKWRQRQAPEDDATSAGGAGEGAASAGRLDVVLEGGPPQPQRQTSQPQRQISVVSVPNVNRFPNLPPGTGDVRGSEDEAVEDQLQRQVSEDSVPVEPSAMFMSDPRHLNSQTPCSAEEINLATQLNALMLEESRSSELVVTNLPDMPPAGSTFGYCQLIEALTKDIKRTVLVRGTTTEVITAFQ